MKAKKLFIELCMLLLVLFFLYTVSIKVLEYDKFIFQLRDSPLRLISFFAPVLAFMVPLLSAAIVVLLLWPGCSHIGLWVALVLLLGFELYIVLVLVSGLPLPCNCSGLHNALNWYWHLGINAGFMGVAGIALLFSSSRANPLSSRTNPLSSRVNPLSSRVNPLSSRVNPLSSRANPLSSRANAKDLGTSE